MELGSSLVQDDFAQEQNLIIKEGEKTFHHEAIRSANKYEDPSLVSQIGEYLKNTGSEYYTCHCTGNEFYKNLKDIMGDKIKYLATGSTVTI